MNNDEFFNYLAERPGLWHILTRIFRFLDTHTLLNCDGVSKNIRRFLIANQILHSRINPLSYEGHLHSKHPFTQLRGVEDIEEIRHKNAKLFFNRLSQKHRTRRWRDIDKNSECPLVKTRDTPVSCVQVLSTNEDLMVLAKGPELILAERRQLEDEGHRVMAFVGHRLDISCLDTSKEGALCVTGSKDRQLILWDLKSVRNPGLSTRDRTIKLWKVAQNFPNSGSLPSAGIYLEQTIGGAEGGHNKSVWGLDVSSAHVATASADTKLKVWKIINHVENPEPGGSQSRPPKYQHVKAAEKKRKKAGGAFAVNDRLRAHCTFENQTPVRHCLLMSSDKSKDLLLLSGDLLGDLNVWSLDTKQHLYQVPEPQGTSAMFRLSGAVVSMSQHENFVAVWFMNRGVVVYQKQVCSPY